MDLTTLLDSSHLTAFVGGTAIGAAGKYFADLFTDQRKRKEEKSGERKALAAIKQKMPGLIAEMIKDLQDRQNVHIREIVILSSKATQFSQSEPRFVYYESQHSAVRSQVKTLAAEGYLDIVRTEEPTIYRLKERFVDQLLIDA